MDGVVRQLYVAWPTFAGRRQVRLIFRTFGSVGHAAGVGQNQLVIDDRNAVPKINVELSVEHLSNQPPSVSIGGGYREGAAP